MMMLLWPPIWKNGWLIKKKPMKKWELGNFFRAPFFLDGTILKGKTNKERKGGL
jgi:hypothetical protein